jgi:hypothetical protein
VEKFKIVLGVLIDPEYHKRIEELRNSNMSSSSDSTILPLYEDENGPIVAKTYGGTFWFFCTIQDIQGSTEDKWNTECV